MLEHFKSILMILDRELSLHLLEDEDIRRVYINSTEFVDREGYYWNGFYDFIRKSEEYIIGIRLWVHDVPDFIANVGAPEY
jgi:hypothetical protein